VIVYFGWFLEKYKSIPNFGASFLYGKSYVLIMRKNGLGNILGDFFDPSGLTAQG
jgi:hypothetical protein